MKKKKTIFLTGMLGVSMLLAACGDDQPSAPTQPVGQAGNPSTSQEPAPKTTEQRIAEYKMLSDEDLKVKVETIRTQRFSALNAISSFIESAYEAELSPNDFKKATENIVQQYQYVYDELQLLTQAFPESDELKNLFEVVDYESKHFVVELLQEYYSYSGIDLKEFKDSVKQLDKDDFDEFMEKFKDEMLILDYEELDDIEKAIDNIFSLKTMYLGSIKPMDMDELLTDKNKKDGETLELDTIYSPDEE